MDILFTDVDTHETISVNHLLAELETLTDHVDDTGIGIEIRQQDYYDDYD